MLTYTYSLTLTMLLTNFDMMIGYRILDISQHGMDCLAFEEAIQPQSKLACLVLSLLK
jgi:hypothetical protein